MKRIITRRIVVIAIGIFVCSLAVKASAEELYRFQSGVRISQERPLLEKQRVKIVSGLRSWTGLTQLEFDTNGELIPGDRTRISDGSETARALILQAVDGRDSYVIERCDESTTIAFAQIESADSYIDGSGGKHRVWKLRIDFSDFAELNGNEEVLAAFDPTASFVHELAHAVKGYFDSVGKDDPLGECEAYVNRMRTELSLPKRVYYFPRQHRAIEPDGGTFVQGELSFVYEASDGSKPKTVVITFNIEKIFDLSKAKSRAQVESNLIAQRRAAGR